MSHKKTKLTCHNNYLLLPKKYNDQQSIPYENEEIAKIKIPSNWILVGPTGSGKTNALINIMKNINAWERFHIYAKELEEPLYRYLKDGLDKMEKKVRKPVGNFDESIEHLTDINSLDKEYSHLFIFDDMINEEPFLLKQIGHFYIRGRKRNATSMFLTQDFYRVPKMIRVNCQYIVIRKVNQIKDLKLILSDYALGLDLSQLVILYQKAVSGDMTNFLLIDLYTTDSAWRFRHNFDPLPWKQMFQIPEGQEFTTGKVETWDDILKKKQNEKKKTPKKRKADEMEASSSSSSSSTTAHNSSV